MKSNKHIANIRIKTLEENIVSKAKSKTTWTKAFRGVEFHSIILESLFFEML